MKNYKGIRIEETEEGLKFFGSPYGWPTLESVKQEIDRLLGCPDWVSIYTH